MMEFYDRFDNVKLRDLIANSKIFESRESSKKNYLQLNSQKRKEFCDSWDSCEQNLSKFDTRANRKW
jgi:hypothetical protein